MMRLKPATGDDLVQTLLENVEVLAAQYRANPQTAEVAEVLRLLAQVIDTQARTIRACVEAHARVVEALDFLAGQPVRKEGPDA